MREQRPHVFMERCRDRLIRIKLLDQGVVAVPTLREVKARPAQERVLPPMVVVLRVNM